MTGGGHLPRRIEFVDTRRFVRFAASVALGAALLLAPLQAPAYAEEEAQQTKRVPLLWEVQTKPKIYLFGTIHLADVRVTTHPPVVAKALEESKALYTELDFATMGADLRKHIMLPTGKTLADFASEEVIAKLERITTHFEIPAAQAAQFKLLRPWLTAVQVPVLVNAAKKAKETKAAAAEAAKEGADEAPKPANPMASLPLDLQLYMGARGEGKTVGGLETPEEQFSIFNELTMEKQVEMLSASLDELMKLVEPAKGDDGVAEPAVDPIEGLLQMYLRGDANAFYEMIQESMGKDPETREFMARLLDRRNVVMVRRMLEAAERHPDKTIFIAVGAGHYPGPVGIVKLLRDTGFRVRRINDVAAMEKAWPVVSAPAASGLLPQVGLRRATYSGRPQTISAQVPKLTLSCTP
jgi:uncharacterized protein YbaP (TraB family)